MIRFVSIASAALALAATTSAQAGEPTAGATAQSAKAIAKKTKKVCRKEETTGSVVPKRVCRTIVVDEAAKPGVDHSAHETTRTAS